MHARWPAIAVFIALCPVPAQQREEGTYFSLVSQDTVLPGGEVSVMVRSSGIRQLEFRLYRIRNPREFVLKLGDPDVFPSRGRRIYPPRTPIEKFADWKRRLRTRLRNLARMQFSAENRSRIRAWLQHDTGRPPTPAGAAPSFAAVPLLNPDQLVKRWTQTVQTKQRWDTAVVRVPLEQAGVYVLEATDQQRTAYTVLISTPLAALVKAWPEKTALRVLDRTSGRPQSGCRVELLDLAGKSSLGQAITDGDGAAHFQVRQQPGLAPLALAGCGGPILVAKVPEHALAPPWRGLLGVIHTDRPVYRPGQTVRFRAIVREERDGRYAQPEARKARVKVDDARGNPAFQKMTTFSKYGTVQGEFGLNADVPLGYFSITVTPDGAENAVYGGFHVEEYRKPDYEVRVRPSLQRTVQGSKVEAQIEARYYYGEPVAGARVEWVVHRYRWYPPWWEWLEEEMEEAEEYFGGEQVFEAKGQLDREGRLNITVPVERGEFDYQYRVEARVMDEGGRTISGAGLFLATRAPFLIRSEAGKWGWKTGETVRWQVSALDFDRQPVPGVAFRVEVLQARQGKPAGEPVLVRTGVTGADGAAVVEFPAGQSGYWIVRAVAQGPAGPVREDRWLWVSGDMTGWQPPEKVRVTLDKSSYPAGETARATVITGVPSADVWLTVEGPALLWSRFIRIDGGAATVEIPVQAEFAPNVFVKAVFVQSDRLYEGAATMKVPPVQHQILVELTPSKAEFQPGEPASFRLTAKDREGRPVRAEFALGVVDEAIYAIQREQQPDLVKVFYGRRWNRVETTSSQSFYFWGEAGTRRIELARRPGGPFRAQLKREQIAAPKVRKDFPDTAFWVADLETNARGEADVRFAFPDSLTTWRATARGVTEDTRVGGAVERVLVRKDIVVSLAAPRFFTEGDETVVPVLARNYTNRTLRARAGLRVEGLTVLEGQEQELELPPQSEGKVDYRLRADHPGRATLTASVAGADGGDALELTVPVQPFGVPMEAAAQARLEGTSSQILVHEFPSGANPSGRSVEVRLAPSLAGAVFAALEYLLEYPYGCTEQVMSSLLPNLVVAEAIRKLKLEAETDRAQLGRNIRAGLEKLYGYQNEDGSWGWWRADGGSLFLTSYVVLGLGHTRENGYPVPEWRRHRAASWLASQLESGPNADLMAYALLSLSMHGKPDARLVERAWRRREEMSAFGLASLGLMMQRTGDERRGEAALLLARIAKQDGQETFWESRVDPMFLHDQEHSFEATAMALRFLASEAPGSPLLDRAAEWLMRNRDRGYYWKSTKRTAFVIYGLIPLLERSGELQPDFTARVFAGGREVLRRRFTAADAVSAKPVRLEAPVAGDRSEVRVEVEGRGRLYASAEWRWRLAAGSGARSLPEGSSLGIERRYYRLRPQSSGGRMTYALEPWGGTARRGDVVAVRITVPRAGRLNAFVVEDPLPAGAEAVARDRVFPLQGTPVWWNWWLNRREMRDDRVSWFPWSILREGFEAVYLFRFTNAGRFRAGPARVEPMYEPGVKAWTEDAVWEVLP
jgi:hypothetical protein